MKVLCFGSLNIDMVYTLPHIVNVGETLAATKVEVFPGGKGLNQAIALGRAFRGGDKAIKKASNMSSKLLGEQVAEESPQIYMAGGIGSDGIFLKKLLASEGINVDYIQVRDDVKSGNAIIQRDVGGQNSIILFGGANREVDKEFVDNVLQNFRREDYLILQNEISNLDYIVEQAGEIGMRIFLNPSPMEESLCKLDYGKIDTIFVNEIEACQLVEIISREDANKLRSRADRRKWGDIAKTLQDFLPETKKVLTIGVDGSYYISQEEIIYQEAFKTNVVDTTAAGDTFSGYYIREVAEKKSIPAALSCASKAASITVSRKGAAPSIPRYEEIGELGS